MKKNFILMAGLVAFLSASNCCASRINIPLSQYSAQQLSNFNDIDNSIELFNGTVRQSLSHFSPKIRTRYDRTSESERIKVILGDFDYVNSQTHKAIVSFFFDLKPSRECMVNICKTFSNRFLIPLSRNTKRSKALLFKFLDDIPNFAYILTKEYTPVYTTTTNIGKLKPIGIRPKS